MSASLSKEFFELIKAIGESKSKQEEERIIVDEVKVLKQALASGSTSRRARELMVRLIYVEMLGHDASWGYVVAVQQTASHDLSQKRAGYLACGLMLAPDHDFRFMLVNQMQRDLASANVLEASAALVALCKLVTNDMVPALITKVTELLEHDQTLVRKKAVMALHRFYQLDTQSVAHLADKIKAKLRDRDPSVMGAALCVLHDMARADPASQSDLVDQYVSILKQITEHRLPREFDHHRMPAPWIQIKLLQLLATLGSNDKRASEAMYEVLGECMRRADTGTNIGYAVVYEVVKTITTIWPDATLLDAAASAISRFITSDSYNLKYLGVTGLAAVVREHPRYAAQHQMAVIECLEDPDETLKRKTLELLFRMTNPVNAEVVVDKLLGFLQAANDQFLRTDLVSRICQLAERYSPDNTWYVETMTRVFTLAGDLVDAEVAHNVLRLLAEGASRDAGEDSAEEDFEVRSVACRLFVEALHKPVVPPILLKVAFWTLGEYAYLLSVANRDRTPEDETLFVELDEAIQLVCDVVERATLSDPVTRCYGVTAVAKMTAQLGRVLPCAMALVERFRSSEDTDLQQRCKELRELFGSSEGLHTCKTVFPVDASCEDFDDADFTFLAEFVEILRAAGAPEYQPPPGFGEGEASELDGLEDDELGASQPAPATQTLRFDAYEAPSVHEVPPPAPNFSPSSQASEGALPEVPARLAPQVKSVWGPQGYTGNLSGTLGGAMAPAHPPPVFASPAESSRPLSPELAPSAAASYPQEEPEEALPPPLPPKKPAERVLSDKERMAQALFGGVGEAKPSSRRGGARAKAQTSDNNKSHGPVEGNLLGEVEEPAAPNLLGDVGAAMAPRAQHSKMEDLFGSAPAPRPADDFNLLSLSSPPSEQRPKPAPSAVSQDLLSMTGFGPAPTAFPSISPVVAPAPKPTSAPPAPQPRGPATSDNFMDLFAAAPAAIPAAPTATPALPLAPKPMRTQEFGQMWAAHAAEKRFGLPNKFAGFGEFLAAAQSGTGLALVELIPATSEAILAGVVADSGGLVALVHTKDRPQTKSVDVMVRTKQMPLSDKVAAALGKLAGA